MAHCLRRIGAGVRRDFTGRWKVYSDDFDISRGKLRVLAAATFIFATSALPVIAFGEQLFSETDGQLSAVQALAATAITGVLQAVAGGQPLLIVGVSEPIVLVYKYMYDFAKDREGLGPELYLAWCGWACVWTAAMVAALALANACTYITRFTRFAGELFGALIAILFLQQAVKGLVEEFRGAAGEAALDPTWQLVNGVWALVLAWALLLCSFALRQARSWRFLRAPLRSFLADYGAPLVLVAVSGLSFAVSGGGGVPRRVRSPNTWQTSTWTVAADMGRVEGRWIAAALIPAALITVLFYFDHSVSAQLAQQEEFNLKKPSAYHYDLLLLGFMTALCGLLGLPPVNGVLPQSPLHTRALAKVASRRRRQHKGGQLEVGRGAGQELELELAKADGGAAAEAPPEDGARSGSPSLAPAPAPAGGVLAGGRHVHPSPSVQQLLPHGSASVSGGDDPQEEALPPPLPPAALSAAQPPSRSPDRGHGVLPVHVYEQRVSGLLQALGVGACLAAMPAIRQIPTAALWGFFAFMALESLPGSQFWDRTLLLLTDPACRAALLERGHAPYLETVPVRTIALFTAFQLAYLGGVYALTWAPIAGILFPLPIMALVPLRQYAMPRFFSQPRHLQELDAAAEEQAAPLPHDDAVRQAAAAGLGAPSPPGPSPGDDLPESELQHLRVLHRLSRESLIRRRKALQAQQEAAAAAGLQRSQSDPPAGGGLPGAGGGLHRPSLHLPHV